MSRQKKCLKKVLVKIAKKYRKKFSTTSCLILQLKFIYSEKATKFFKIFSLLLSYALPVKSKMNISQNFVAISEYMNFEFNSSSIIYCTAAQKMYVNAIFWLIHGFSWRFCFSPVLFIPHHGIRYHQINDDEIGDINNNGKYLEKDTVFKTDYMKKTWKDHSVPLNMT